MQRRGEAGGELRHGVNKREPSAHGPLSIVLVRLSVIPGQFNDLVAAWQVAGLLRRQQPHAMFVAGEMCSTE